MRFFQEFGFRFFQGHVVGCGPFLQKADPAVGHHRAGQNAIHLDAVHYSLHSECLCEGYDGRIDGCYGGKCGFWLKG